METHALKTFRAWLTETLDVEQIEDLASHLSRHRMARPDLHVRLR